MYNKYLIELYTGIFPDPEKAALISQQELFNLVTPQTFARYAWALSFNKRNSQAYKVFQEQVSGRPLEAMELYWMGSLLDNMH